MALPVFLVVIDKPGSFLLWLLEKQLLLECALWHHHTQGFTLETLDVGASLGNVVVCPF